MPHTADSAVFDRVAALRRSLADLVETLSDAELATGSLCVGWDVRTVAAHLTLVPTTSPLRFGGALVAAGGNVGRAIDRLSRAAAAGRSGRDIAAVLRAVADSTATPPGVGARAPLTDLLIHRADIELPLGRRWEPAADDLATALAFLARSPRGFVPSGRLAGVRLVATDLGRSWGSGSDAVGPAADLALAVCGRRDGFAGLTGDGARLLESRLTASPQGPPRG